MNSPTHLIRRPCQIVTRSQTGPPDRYGAPTWTDTVRDSLVAIFPVASSESADRPAGEFTHQAFFRAGTVITTRDRVVVATGQAWEVVGPPRTWTHPKTLEDLYVHVDLVGWTDDEGDA